MSTRRPTPIHRLEYGLYRGVESLLRHFPLDDCVRMGRAVGSILHAVSPKYRRLVHRNLRIATADDRPSAEQIDQMVKETFRSAGANFLATLRSQLLPVDDLLKRISSEGINLLSAPETADRGIVVAMAHMGNWEALFLLGSTFSPNRSYGGIYRPLDNPLMDALTRERRTKEGGLIFSRKDGFHAPSSMLRKGGTLAVLADQRAGASGIPMPFFGKMTTCSPLPDLMARRSKARVATLGIATTKPGEWSLKMIPVPESGGTRGIMKQLEVAMRVSLTDVFWFHDRWRTDSARPLSFFTKLDPEITKEATLPLRLLLTSPPTANEADIQRFIAAMFRIRPDLQVDRLISQGATSHDPRVILHQWDPTTPPEQCLAAINKVDLSHPAPLDGALFFGGETALASAARRMGLRAVIGLDVPGKPWSRSFPHPVSSEDWVALADRLAHVPTRKKGP